MNAYFKPMRRVDANYKLFIHLYTGIRKGWINADRFPIPASNEWQPNEITKIGPIQIFIWFWFTLRMKMVFVSSKEMAENE